MVPLLNAKMALRATFGRSGDPCVRKRAPSSHITAERERQVSGHAVRPHCAGEMLSGSGRALPKLLGESQPKPPVGKHGVASVLIYTIAWDFSLNNGPLLDVQTASSFSLQAGNTHTSPPTCPAHTPPPIPPWLLLYSSGLN